jgi:hypothetical protein
VCVGGLGKSAENRGVDRRGVDARATLNMRSEGRRVCRRARQVRRESSRRPLWHRRRATVRCRRVGARHARRGIEASTGRFSAINVAISQRALLHALLAPPTTLLTGDRCCHHPPGRVSWFPVASGTSITVVLLATGTRRFLNFRVLFLDAARGDGQHHVSRGLYKWRARAREPPGRIRIKSSRASAPRLALGSALEADVVWARS